jgi:hypothetical protein
MPIQTKRIPFASDLATRDGTLTKDTRLVNAVFERDGSDIYITKRPGLVNQAVNAGLSNIGGTGITAFEPASQELYIGQGTKLYTWDYAAGTPTDTGQILSGNQISFCRTYLDKNLFFHDRATFWNTVNGTSYTNPTRPATGSWCYGAVWLNDYVYVGNADNNLIYGSYAGDPTNWSSLCNISFYMTTDKLIALAKHLNYVVAFGNKSLQFYYDAGTGNGSTSISLATSGSYTSEVGCYSAFSIASTDNLTVWVSLSDSKGLGVHVLEGTSPVKISTPSVDKILEKYGHPILPTGFLYKFNGHECYILNVLSGSITLVYDFSTKMWCQWTTFNGSELQYSGAFYAASVSQHKAYVQDFFSGKIYSPDIGTYQDNGQPIYTRGVTELQDHGSTKMKFIRRAEIVGDLSPATTIQLSYSTDDYNSFSSPRTIPEAVGNRPAVYQLGQSRRRAWQMLHTDNTPLRLEALEVDFDEGEMDV